MTAPLLFVAFIATVYATASLLTGYAGDFTASALVAVAALGAVVFLEHARHMRELRRREREQVWHRREREWL